MSQLGKENQPKHSNPGVSKMEEYALDISTIDVYELASGIGKEFEKVIDTYGADVVTNLMPKVISSLEHLEALATKNERENAVLEDLKSRIVKLEYDKHVRAEDRVKYEKELEQIEEEWRNESNNLLSVITKLQDENKKLTSIVANQSYEQDSALGSDIDDSIINQLQNQVENLREKLKNQNKEISVKCAELESLHSQVETLTGTISDFKKKQKLHFSQVNDLIDERTKLLVQIKDYREEINTLSKRLGSVERENEDLVKCSTEVPQFHRKLSLDNDDPDRPRFTTNELKEILHERNDLKTRLNELQDELAVYKCEASFDALHDEEVSADVQNEDSLEERYAAIFMALRLSENRDDKMKMHQHIPSFFPPPGLTRSLQKTELDSAFESTIDDDLPVQGPLPPEPDDAPWKRSESGIRKLFRKIFGDQSSPIRRLQRPLYSSAVSTSSSTVSHSPF